MNGSDLCRDTPDRNQPVPKKYQPLTAGVLAQENRRFADTGGVSRNNASLGFKPAFYDSNTDTAYLSRFRDGRPAPFHLIDGLPASLFAPGPSEGSAGSLRPGVIAGFILDARFYTREQAAAAARKAARH